MRHKLCIDWAATFAYALVCEIVFVCVWLPTCLPLLVCGFGCVCVCICVCVCVSLCVCVSVCVCVARACVRVCVYVFVRKLFLRGSGIHPTPKKRVKNESPGDSASQKSSVLFDSGDSSLTLFGGWPGRLGDSIGDSFLTFWAGEGLAPLPGQGHRKGSFSRE